MQQDILFWQLQKLEPCGVFPGGIHHIADHPAPDIPIISATGDFFVDRPFFCGIEKEFTVDLIQVFRYPVVFDPFQIFFYHYPLQLGEQVVKDGIIPVKSFFIDPRPFAEFFDRDFFIIHFTDHIFKRFLYGVYCFLYPQIFCAVDQHFHYLLGICATFLREVWHNSLYQKKRPLFLLPDTDIINYTEISNLSCTI